MAQMKAFKILMQLCQSPLQTSMGGGGCCTVFLQNQKLRSFRLALVPKYLFPPISSHESNVFSLNRQACEINSWAIFLCVIVIWPIVSLKIDILTSLEVFYCSNLIFFFFFFGGGCYHKNLSRRRDSAACPAQRSPYHL